MPSTATFRVVPTLLQTMVKHRQLLCMPSQILAHRIAATAIVALIGVVSQLDAMKPDVPFDSIANRAIEDQRAATHALYATPHAQKTPRARACHAAAYASTLGGIAIFGGARVCGRDVLADDTLWLWNGQQWSALATGGPSAREDAQMVFDSRRGVLVLYGGRRDERVLADTWEWSRNAGWKRIESTNNPGALEHSAMAFDSVRGRVVLFGGAFPNQFKDETWEWSGAVWTKINAPASPAARIGHSMLWDAGSRSVVLYGGFSPSTQFRDMWRWNGQRWLLADSVGPTYSEGPSLAFHNGELMIAGAGLADGKVLNVWTYSAGRWTSRSVAQPAALLVGAVSTFDAGRGRMVITGGGETNEPGIRVVEFDGKRWVGPG